MNEFAELKKPKIILFLFLSLLAIFILLFSIVSFCVEAENYISNLLDQYGLAFRLEKVKWTMEEYQCPFIDSSNGKSH